MMTAHFLQANAPSIDGPTLGAEVFVSLVDEVDFKWLMAGHGWWVDTSRLRRDLAYAEKLLGLALASGSPALRECALQLQTRVGAADAADAASLSPVPGAGSPRGL